MRNTHCATCGKRRRPLERPRPSWSSRASLARVPRRDDVDGKPWQQLNDLIIVALVYRNGGTAEDCHLCDDCLRLGLRRIKEEVDAALEVTDAGDDKTAELVALTEKLAQIQGQVREVAQLRGVGLPWFAWNHSAFLQAVSMLWHYYQESATLYQARFGDCQDFWTELRAKLDQWAKEKRGGS